MHLQPTGSGGYLDTCWLRRHAVHTHGICLDGQPQQQLWQLLPFGEQALPSLPRMHVAWQTHTARPRVNGDHSAANGIHPQHPRGIHARGSAGRAAAAAAPGMSGHQMPLLQKPGPRIAGRRVPSPQGLPDDRAQQAHAQRHVHPLHGAAVHAVHHAARLQLLHQEERKSSPRGVRQGGWLGGLVAGGLRLPGGGMAVALRGTGQPSRRTSWRQQESGVQPSPLLFHPMCQPLTTATRHPQRPGPINAHPHPDMQGGS